MAEMNRSRHSNIRVALKKYIVKESKKKKTNLKWFIS